MDLKYQIPIVRGILELLGWISDSQAQDSGFHKQIFDSPYSGLPLIGALLVLTQILMGDS